MARLSTESIHTAGATLWRHWQLSTRMGPLADDCRPRNREEGYAVQTEVARLSGQARTGWKIAATSTAGQRHIGVDGPLAGQLLVNRQIPAGGVVPVAGNAMKVAEAEFAFQMGRALPRRADPWLVDDVVTAAAAMHPAIEIPDSRFEDLASAGAPQLIADNACACWFVIGKPAADAWRSRDLSAARVTAYRDDEPVGEGTGANVLGDPRIALAWLANELNAFGEELRAGDIVMTGTCIVPIAIAGGERLRMQFHDLGSVSVDIAQS